jgi:hypothetical protein
MTTGSPNPRTGWYEGESSHLQNETVGRYKSWYIETGARRGNTGTYFQSSCIDSYTE